MMVKKRNNLPGRKSIALIEALVSGVILAVSLGSLVVLFMHCGMLTHTTLDTASVFSQVQSRMEQVRNTDFENVLADFGPPNNIFDITRPVGKGVIYLSQPFGNDLVQVRITASWQSQRDLSIIGEDTNLNGMIDGGEDLNGNGELDSVVSMTSFMARRF